MLFHPDDTIAALASPAGPAARGIVRISGPGTRAVLDTLFDPDDPARWHATRTATRHTGRFRFKPAATPTSFLHPPPLPIALHLWPTRRSFTGQPAAEIHAVGSPPLLEAVLTALYTGGVRPARPGEFTLRAFLAGRVDLVQAEAVLGVIYADDHRELELALKQLSGGLSGRIADVRSDLLNLLADLEAGLDFVDEDIEFVSREDVMARLSAARDTVAALLDQAEARMQSTGRRLVVLAGLPNAGKSTLFNALVGREAALVSEVRGTTRDYLTAELDWNGTAIELVDTAGWEPGGAGLMQQAHALRSGQLERADLILFCTPVDAAETEQAQELRFRAELGATAARVLPVRTKCDLAGRSVPLSAPTAVAVSASTQIGLRELIEKAATRLTESHTGERQLLGMTAARSRESLATAQASLEHARDAADLGAGDELVALEVRAALDHLGRILGAVYTDDILDRIFSRFCIGK